MTAIQSSRLIFDDEVISRQGRHDPRKAAELDLLSRIQISEYAVSNERCHDQAFADVAVLWG